MRRIMVITALLAVSGGAAFAYASPGAARPATAARSAAVDPGLAVTLSRARIATAKYSTNLAAAKADGYQIITKMIPDMGYHYLNPKVTGFNPAKPAILVYLKRGSTWQLEATLPSCDVVASDRFGESAALGSDAAVIGAFEADAPVVDTGAAYVFRRHGTEWIQEARLRPPNPTTNMWFGAGVAITDRYVAVSAVELGNFGPWAGAVYLFEHVPNATQAIRNERQWPR